MGRTPNVALQDLIALSGASHKALAHRINTLARQAGHATSYTHTSVANWVHRGMVPRPPGPALLAQALSERLGRRVDVNEIGLGSAVAMDDDVGLSFPRSLPAALQAAGAFWSSMDRRDFLTATFTAAAFGPPALRWTTQRADPTAARRGHRRIGRPDIQELEDLAEQARHTDSRFGGGSVGMSAVALCLRDVAAPMLSGDYTEEVGRRLFSAAAVLGRLAGWSDFDTGHHGRAQRHFIQALRMARAAGDVGLGGYILSCMALQSCLRGYHDEALDLIDAATAGTRNAAPPRVRAFLHLVEARVHGRARRPRAAGRALAVSESLLEQAAARTGDDPSWIDFYTPERLAADAVEIHRDLDMPRRAHEWNARATMPVDRFARSYGIRLAVTASAHAQAGDVDAAAPALQDSIDVLSPVSSPRAWSYVHDAAARLRQWPTHPLVRDVLVRVENGRERPVLA
ncbi:sporulation protein [Streptomonospora nanhaiensis]|uniref:hypothetical protein n=1 Tax=Streptomonospora nanhaiensis TaxID=1323731 RepID=UPI001C3873A0|nr:hypothetical protein [Streptomonospora nanhaiensis]MBV2364975.1 hypothetical protein [Streptomonospora nanhaiensis]MBX9389807.1 hypothetical protein [Streptomonospora nanhaiensis]